jgi:YggT family protein
VAVVFWIVYAAISVFMLVMWVRLIFDFVMALNRDWRPRGIGLVVAEVVFTITDPPIKLVRRVLPPLRFGSVMLDLSWTVVMLLAILLSWVCFRFL